MAQYPGAPLQFGPYDQQGYDYSQQDAQFPTYGTPDAQYGCAPCGTKFGAAPKPRKPAKKSSATSISEQMYQALSDPYVEIFNKLSSSHVGNSVINGLKFASVKRKRPKTRASLKKKSVKRTRRTAK